MQGRSLLFAILRIAVATSLLGVAQFCAGQFIPASPPIADPNDKRFDAESEDWSSPALDKSHLTPVPPLSSGIAVKSNCSVEMVRLQWRFGDPIDVYVMKPKGVEKPPVVLYLFGHTADTDLFRDEHFEQGSTRDGFAAVGFVSALAGPRFHDRPITQWFVSELPESLATSAHDVQMILDYLAKRGDLDMTRVGMFAQDSGASVAILAAAVDPRIKVLDVIDPWGDWPDWLAHSPVVPDGERPRYTTPEFLNKLTGLDPMSWLPKVQGKVRVQNALFVPGTPPEAREKLLAAVPAGGTVVVYKTPTDTQEILQNNQILQWIHQGLAQLPPSDIAKLPSLPAAGKKAGALRP